MNSLETNGRLDRKNTMQGTLIEKMTLYERFETDIQKLFSRIEDYEEILIMNMFNPKDGTMEQFFSSTAQFESKKLIEKFTSDRKEKDKYRDSVLSYTKKLVGSKLSLNTVPFTKTQIESGKTNLKNPAIFRVITKWIEELEKCF